MGFIESVGAASAAEKIGWLGLVGGGCVTIVKVIRWLAALEKAAEIAKEERKEMLEEIRGLRMDLNDLYSILIQRA